MALLEVKELYVSFQTPAGQVQAVNGVSFSLERGQVLGIVGESGSGKSVTSYSILQILPKNAQIQSGSVLFEGQELLGAPERVLRTIRGNRISMIFQDPMTSLNPTHTVGRQLEEAILLHTGRTRAQARQRALELLRLVRITDPEKRLKQYPFELSGGMRQRVMIAMAIACEPDILIADEPTTALDVTIQAQILELLDSLCREMGMAMILITHDLGVVAQLCQRVLVMYAGSVCEEGSAMDLFRNPRHEYTRGLLRSVPSPDQQGQLQSIAGTPVDLTALPKGCPFSPRCPAAMKICVQINAPLAQVDPGHRAACWNHIRKQRGMGNGE